MMFSGEPAIHRVPGPWVVLAFGFWFLVFGFWFLVFGCFSAGRTSVLQIFILFLLSEV